MNTKAFFYFCQRYLLVAISLAASLVLFSCSSGGGGSSTSQEFKNVVLLDESRGIITVLDINESLATFLAPPVLEIPYSGHDSAQRLSYDAENDILFVTDNSEAFYAYDGFSQGLEALDNSIITTRAITSQASLFQSTSDMDMDTETGRLYLIDGGSAGANNGQLFAFDSSSDIFDSSVLSPSVNPSEIIIPGVGLSADSRVLANAEQDRVYVLNRCSLYRIDNASEAADNANIEVIITFAEGCDAQYYFSNLSFDNSRDILYLSKDYFDINFDNDAAEIYAIDDFSTVVSGAISLDSLRSVTRGFVYEDDFLPATTAVEINAATDKLYIFSNIGDVDVGQLLIYENTSTAQGIIYEDPILDAWTNDILLLR